MSWQAERIAKLQSGRARATAALEMRQAGATYREIGEKFGVGANRARQLCLRAERRKNQEPAVIDTGGDRLIRGVVRWVDKATGRPTWEPEWARQEAELAELLRKSE